jgi:hypothetical protein
VSGIGTPATGIRAWGTARLNTGMAAVEAPALLGTSIIVLAIQEAGGTIAMPYVSSRAAGQGFVISSLSDRDTSLVAWLIIG